ncbi:MAG: hypothetical protein ACRCX8_12895 [Sarcina sp.]
MLATKESRTKNYKENIIKGFDAVTHVVNLLFKTPTISLPYSLGLGFELRDLLFKDLGSDEYESSLNDLKRQIRHAVGNSDVKVSVDRTGDTTEIVLRVTVDDERTINISVPVENNEPKYKDIIVK